MLRTIIRTLFGSTKSYSSFESSEGWLRRIRKAVINLPPVRWWRHRESWPILSPKSSARDFDVSTIESRWSALSWPSRTLRHTLDLLVAWVLSRSIRMLPFAVPSIVLSLGFVVCSGHFGPSNRPEQLTNLMSQVKQSHDSGDHARAELWLRLAMERQPDREELKIAYSTTLVHLHRGDEARAMVRKLANEQGSTRAAYWLAKNCLSTLDSGKWTEADHQQFRQWMSIALGREDGWSLEERELTMARYLVSIGANGESLSLLTRLAPNHPEVALPTSIILAARGQDELAKHHAHQATLYLTQSLRKRQSDTQIRAQLVQAFVMLQQEEKALQVISDGLMLNDQHGLRSLKADTLILWAHRLKQKDAKGSDNTRTFARRLELVCQAAQIAPNRPIVMDAVFDIAMECRSSESSEVRNLISSVVQSVDPNVLHMIRGTIAAMEGNSETAIFHLRMAETSAKELPVIYNNLAVVIGTKPDGNLDEALRLVNLAINADESQPYFRETRGQLLSKLNRHREALEDLQLALQCEELSTQVLPTLISSCQNLGLNDLEQTYRDQLSLLSESRSLGTR